MDVSFLQKYNKPGPRYTSYPPATFFHEGIGATDYQKMLQQSNLHQPQNISVYIHIPFCRQLCHFCGCNTSQYPREEVVQKYVQALIEEIKMVSESLDTHRPLTQVHWGGGTPNAIDLKYVQQVMEVLFHIFTPDPHAEIAMECNPAWLQLEDIDRLADMGFNRLSLGIQDFDEKVLKLVNRQPSNHKVQHLVDRMRGNNMKGVNIDLVYGLPGQTEASFGDTIRQAIAIAPDRLVTFSYAHVPWVKAAQKTLEQIGLPEPQEKLAMFAKAYNLLTRNGYTAIGMDHYARPHDELAVALQNRKLHRNFQGYCTQKTTGQVYAFGATAISQLDGGYYQNAKDANAYIRAVEQNGFATQKGYELTNPDRIRRKVINELMCNGFLDFDELADGFGITADELKSTVGYDAENLQPFVDDGLILRDRNILRLGENGFLVVRNIAMAFDPLLPQGKGKYSKTV